MPLLPNQRHERFAQGVAMGKPASVAYVEAGYQTSGNAAEACASRLLSDARVSARVKELLERASEGVILTKQWVLERLIENANRAMQAEEVQRDGKGTGEYRYEGSVANRALELLGKELGMFVDRKEVGQPGEFERMGEDELRASIVRDLEALGRKDLAAAFTGGKGKPSNQSGGVH